MATVNGLTKERMILIEAKSVVGGTVDSAGVLQLVTRDGTKIEAGSVKGPKGDVGPPSSALSAWPIGSIYMNGQVSTNPALLLGGGTWVRWASGRVPVGVYEADSRFDTVNESGGEYAVTLSVFEMPAHKHGVYDPGHSHEQRVLANGRPASNGDNLEDFTRGAFSSGVYGQGTNTGASGTGIQTYDYGGGQAHNNVQPYTTCYMWMRTA